MPYRATESEDAVILTPAESANAAVLWLHGLGADGYDFVPIVDELRLPAALAVRFIFPHARPRPVTINNGYVMRAWYDIKGLAATGQEDDAGIRESENLMRQYIESEIQAGIPAHRIVIAGFSQGGAVALQTGLRYPQRLAGILALSTYLPLRSTVAKEANAAARDLPILMCHGSRDGVVPQQLAEMSRDALTQLGYTVQWRSYPMEHQVCAQEIDDIGAWLQSSLGRNL
jgi:phospholipase/carboxylesterase